MLLHLFSEETFEELISKLAAKVDVSGLKNVINVNRDDVLEGAFRVSGDLHLTPRNC